MWFWGDIIVVDSTIRRIVHQANTSYLPFLAGSLAFHAFFLSIPLLILVLVVLSSLTGEATITYVVEMTKPYLTTPARKLLADTIRSGSNRSEVVVLGVGALLWILLRIFRGLDIAFATIYDASTHTSIWGQIRSGVVASLAISLALLATFAVGAIITLFPGIPPVPMLNVALFVVVLVAVFFPLYYLFPNIEVVVREVLPGTVVAATGWTIFHVLFQVYATNALTLEVYGVLGAVLSILIWLYASMFILLLGAVVNAVLADRV